MKKSVVRSILWVSISVVCLSIPAAVALAGESDKPIDSISDVPRKARLALFQAYEARGNGDYQTSSRILMNFIERNPGDDHFLIHYHLGNSMSQTHDEKHQLEQYIKCVEMEPRFAKGWMSLGEVAYNLGEYALAAEALDKAFHLGDEKKPQVLYYAAAAYVMAEQPDKATPLLEELVGGKWGEPKMEWYKALVSAALQSEDRETGARAVAGMLDRFGNDPDAWTLAFQYAAGISDHEQAAVALKIKSYLTPLTREEQMQLGDLYAAIGVPREASENYASATVEGADTQELERLASSYLAAHDSEKALQTLQRALKQEPTPRLWSLYGDLNFMERRYNEAFQAYQNSAEMDAEEGRAYLMMAYCAMETGDKENAVKHLKIAADYPEQQEKATQILGKIDVYLP